MPLMATERIRLTFDLPERVRRALNVLAARKGLTVGEAIEQLVEEHCPEDLAIADRAIEEGAAGPKAKRRKAE